MGLLTEEKVFIDEHYFRSYGSGREGRPSLKKVGEQFREEFNKTEFIWDIVCEKNWYPTLALVLFSVGGLVGNYIFGYLQDGIGRRLSFFLYLLVECVFGVATAFAPNFISWTICRVGVGFTVPAIMGTPFVLAIELVGASKRTLTTILTNIWYSVTLVILAGVVYAIRDWTQLALATTLPFATFLFYWWVLPESPRWLLAHGKFEEAEKIICKIARVNGKSLPPDYMVTLKRRFKVESAVKEMEDKNRQIYGVSDLFRSPNMIKKTLVITFLWFTNTSVYVGLSYYAPILGGNEYLNFFLAGVAELPTYFFLWPSMEYWGRRWTICASMVIGGISCLATFLVRHNQAATLFLYCVGKFGISSSFVALPLMGMELYPTVVRGLGLGFSSMAGMIGPILIPFINYLGEEFLVLPLMIMGGLLTVGGLSALILPETLNQHLPQTLEDGEEFGKDWELKDYLQCCPAKSSSIDGSIKEEEEDEDRAESPLRSLLECQETLSLQNELLSERGSTADEGPLEEAVRVTVL